MSIVVAPIGERIKALRKQKKISQKDLAAKLGITSNTLYRYEHGDISISLEMLANIAEALDMSFLELVGDTKENRQAIESLAALKEDVEALLDYNLPDEVKLPLLRSFAQLNDDGRNKVIEYVEDITPKYKK